ncbi:MAG: zinc-dependent alcohol dehydrogenase [Thermomicrobiales bacterium]|nr:zinc-dependent alcohol dehydrogenase [Thermomicrobiales bacterium]
MTATMEAAVVEEFGQPLVLKEVPVPVPGPGEVLIKVSACGVCHTDLHAARGDWPVKPALPFIPGHEATGHVVDLGPGVDHLNEGDRVGAPWLHSACGTCEYCLNGWETLCPRQTNTGYTVNGGFAEYLTAPAAFATRLPDQLGFDDAAPILCAGVTTYKGLKETETQPGEWVVISGVGGLGHIAVQYAVAMGKRVIAVDIANDKLDLARALGAEITLNAATLDPVDEVDRLIGGAHGALVTAVSPIAFSQAVGMLRRGGTASLVGIPPGTFQAPIFDVVLKRLTIRGSIVGTRADLAEALDFAARGKIRATFETQPLEAINSVLDRLQAGEINGRVVLQV